MTKTTPDSLKSEVEEEFAKEIAFLKEIGCDKLPHSGRTLLDHLIGTAVLLRERGRNKRIQRAGLFHSIYGTAGYKKSEDLNVDRNTIAGLIGYYSEFLVFIFCKTECRTTKILADDYFHEPERTHLRWIEWANLVEQGSKSTEVIEKLESNLKSRI